MVFFLFFLLCAARSFGVTADQTYLTLSRDVVMKNGVVYTKYSPTGKAIIAGNSVAPSPSPTPDSFPPSEPTPSPSPSPTPDSSPSPTPTPTPTPAPTPTDAELLSSLRGTAAPWGAIGTLAARVPQSLSHDELAWVASNFNLLSSTDLLTIKTAVGGSSAADRLWSATYLAPALAAIIANPASSATGSFGPYAQLYAYAVSGYTGGSPSNIAALQPTTTGSTAPPASVTYLRSTFDAAKWQEVLSYPLSVSQKANIQTVLGGSTGFNASVTPAVRSALLAQLALLTPAF